MTPRGEVRAPVAIGKVPASRHPLLTGPILPTLLRLAMPNMLAMAATALVAIAETTYVGRLGVAELAGIALVFPMVMLQQMMSAGAMGGGVSSAISRALGGKDVERAEALARHAVIIGIVAGLAFSVIFLGFGARIFRLLGGSGAALEQALAYAGVAFTGSIAVWLTNTLASVVRGTGNMTLPSAVLVLVAVIQIVAGGSLGLGLGGFAGYGMAGIAAGQVIAFTVGCGALVGYLVSGKAPIRLRLAGPLRVDLFRDILKVGALACISPIQSVLTVLVMTSLVARFGTEALAGYGIGARLEFLLVPITFAIGVASVPMVGMAIGAGDIARARRVAWCAGAFAGLSIGAVGIVLAFAPDLWTRWFTGQPAVLAAAASYFTYAAPAFGFLGLALALYFASMGSGKILGPVLAQTVRLLVIVAGGWWLSRSGADVTALFALVGVALVAYGLAAVLSVLLVDWRPPADQPRTGSPGA